MNSRKKYDLVILGGSIPGYYTAIKAAEHGLKTAIVEENRIGGIQTMATDMPIQTLLSNDKILQECIKASSRGLSFNGAAFDPNSFYESIRKNADSFSGGLVEDLKKHGVDVYLGHGLPKTDHSLAVIREGSNTRIFDWDKLVYAGEPATDIPDKIKQKVNGYYTASNFGLLDTLPSGLIIYGGGEKALQAALIWSGLGSQVYLVTSEERLLPTVSEDVEERYITELQKRGVNIYTRHIIDDVYEDSGGIYHMDIQREGTQDNVNLKGSELIVLNEPCASLVGLEAMNLEIDNGWIETNDRLQTSIKDVYTWTGSALSNEYKESAEAAAQFIADTIAGEITGDFEPSENVMVLNLNPVYAQVGMVDKDELEDEEVIYGSFPSEPGSLKSAEEFFEIVIDPEFGEIIGARGLGVNALEAVNTVAMIMDMEGSAYDIDNMIIADSSPLKIVQKAVKDAVAHNPY